MITRMGDAAVVMDFGMVTRMRTGPQGEVLLNQDANRFGKLRYGRPLKRKMALTYIELRAHVSGIFCSFSVFGTSSNSRAIFFPLPPYVLKPLTYSAADVPSLL